MKPRWRHRLSAMRMHWSLCACLSAMPVAAQDNLALLVWQDEAGLHWHKLAAGGDAAVTPATFSAGEDPALAEKWDKLPFGSMWKLFVYFYLQQTANAVPDYPCSKRGAQRDEEEYCCEPGQSIGRELALARSCGPYFAPARLGLNNLQWRAFWQQQLGSQPLPLWLSDVSRLQGASPVRVQELLHVLYHLPPELRQRARPGLLNVLLQGTLQDALPQLGSNARMKTFTWAHPHHAPGSGVKLGGVLGFAANGNPFLLAAKGSSRQVMQRWGVALQQALHHISRRPDLSLAPGAPDEPCVEVSFFQRYPLASVHMLDSAGQVLTQPPLRPGSMRGRYRLRFANGNQLSLQASPALQLQQVNGRWQIDGRFALNEYVARVVEREGVAGTGAAARALAVAARTYLQQNARSHGSCLHIADSSQTQRVSPNPPTAAALAASWDTDGLILSGMPVRYHQNRPAPGVLAWEQALQQAGRGWDMQQILLHAYPRAALRAWSGNEDCKPLPGVENWLRQAERHWRRRLQTEAGFEAPPNLPLVCELDYGNPYSDQRRLRIWVRPQIGQQERIALAHEYLHLAFRYHPRGQDEDWLEQTARKLEQELPGMANAGAGK